MEVDAMRLELRDWMKELIERPAREASASLDELALDIRVDDTSSAPHTAQPESGGVRLRARVVDRAWLDLDVQAWAWSPAVERALYEALDKRNTSLVAGLLLWEWRAVRQECQLRAEDGSDAALLEAG
jgi:hypothetical protein